MPGMVVAWPTKLSMAPVLADEVFEILQLNLMAPGGFHEIPPRRRVATRSTNTTRNSDATVAQRPA